MNVCPIGSFLTKYIYEHQENQTKKRRRRRKQSKLKVFHPQMCIKSTKKTSPLHSMPIIIFDLNHHNLVLVDYSIRQMSLMLMGSNFGSP